MSMTAVPSEPRRRTAHAPEADTPDSSRSCTNGNHVQPFFCTLSVPAKDPAAVSVARRLLLSTVRTWELVLTDETLHDLELLTGEAIANAVLHTTGPCAVSVRWTGTRLRVEVTDTAAPVPVQRGLVEPHAECGRGLTLIAALAATWGSAGTATGKVTWFEVGPALPGDLDGAAR
ncbi:ATP-binding protein [Streptomyces sp. NPDC006984]|uniref:ATP-binding protein n=1 Tax=Streptomyces sp. NPDC006984 TaxID=3155463 RepID=UPI0033E5F170